MAGKRTPNGERHVPVERARSITNEKLSEERREIDAALGVERAGADALLRSRDEILAMISHDLRNIVSNISLKISVLGRVLDGKAAGDPGALVDTIARSCKVIGRWSDDLVDIASLDAGLLALDRKPWPVGAIVNGAVQDVLALAAEKQIELSVHVHVPDETVLGDRDRISQVLTNLLHNALKFTPPQGNITVTAEPLDGEVRFSVTDSGPGITEDDCPKVFELGWRAARCVGGGVGLGLYICRRVIEWHGGRIWVESAPGRGSTFFFTLPTSASAPS